MEKTKFWCSLLVIFFITFLYGCAATYNTNFPLMEKGISLTDVTRLIGKPISAASGPDDTKILYYRLASSPLDTDGSDTREYFVLFREKTVIGYGERTDEVTNQRQIRQFNAAWRAATLGVVGGIGASATQ